jgi:hypothetical protein
MVVKLKEVDIGIIFVEILRKLGFTTYQEVVIPDVGIIDVVGELGGGFIAFSLKTSLSSAVIEQAEKIAKFCDMESFIVCPRSRNISEIQQYYIKKHGLHYITLDFTYCNDREKFIQTITDCISGLKLRYSSISEFMQWLDLNYSIYFLYSYINDLKDIDLLHCWWLDEEKKDKRVYGGIRKIEDYLNPDQKDSIAGSLSGGAITPFKRSCKLLREYLKEHDEIKTVKQLWGEKKNEIHWRSIGGLRGALSTLGHLAIIREINDLLRKHKEKK